MENKEMLRRWLGVFSLMIGVAALTLNATDTGVIKEPSSEHQTVLVVLLVVWIFVSALVKLLMILKTQNRYLINTSLILWFVVMFGAWVTGGSEFGEYTKYHQAICTLFLFGWLLMDLFDLVLYLEIES